MLTNMRPYIVETAFQKKAVPGFNIFGYEDARAVIDAAETLGAPAILMTNKDCVEHMPLESLTGMLRPMAIKASIPVCIHLDHAKSEELVYQAIEAGYTSVMFDGSALPLKENISRTSKLVQFAHAANVSVEGEVGSVAYADRNPETAMIYTDPEEAFQFATETGVDLMAVSVGTLHRMQTQGAVIQYDRLKTISERTNTALVIHGATGISEEDLSHMIEYNIAKFNIGTALRIAFGNALKAQVAANPNEFDRLKLFQEPMNAVRQAAILKYKQLGW